jgi:ParB/RepB/Spo0J family partition protein
MNTRRLSDSAQFGSSSRMPRLGNEALRERVRMVPIDRITPNPHNPRTHPPKQIRQIADSIHAFGFTSPLLVDEDLNLIAGHGRFAAALTLGMSEIPVLVLSGLSPAKRRALAIADNRIAEGAGWDRGGSRSKSPN